MRSTVSKDGRIKLPKRIQDHLGLAPGMRIAFDITPSGTVFIRRANQQPDRLPIVDRFRALRGTASSGMSTDEVMRLTRGSFDLPD